MGIMPTLICIMNLAGLSSEHTDSERNSFVSKGKFVCAEMEHKELLTKLGANSPEVAAI